MVSRQKRVLYGIKRYFRMDGHTTPEADVLVWSPCRKTLLHGIARLAIKDKVSFVPATLLFVNGRTPTLRL